MSAVKTVVTEGVADVVMEAPPVNALTVAGWFELADAITVAGRRDDVRAIVLRAVGRGFNAGVDIKEIQAAADPAHALLGANRGCAAAFAAVYDCLVPVVTAGHGHCLGGGIGLAGNSDVIVAADTAYFGLPEVDRGALGAATHLSRLVPQHKMRSMVYLAEHITAAEMAQWGALHAVVPEESLADTARGVALQIAAKSAVVIRAAKQSLNGIDPWDVKRSYRYEQGFTFELHLEGVADEHRAAFVDHRTTDVQR